MNNKKTLFAILAIGLFFVVGCGQTTTETATSHTEVNVEDDHGSEVQSTGEIKEFDIIARNWEFVPDTIEVNLGDKVELHIESVEGTHGFSLSDFGINERLEPHQDVHVDFIADKTGTFTFACSVPCGSGHSRMSGQLIVK